MAKTPPKTPKNPLPKDPLLKQAVLENKVAYRPQKQAIRQQTRQGTQDYHNAMARVSQVGQALLGQLGQIPGAYNAQSAPILGNLTNSIGSLGTMLNSPMSTVPAAEQAAGNANVGAIGAGAAEQISSQQQIMNDYLASGANQAAVQGAVTARNYTKDYLNFKKNQAQSMTNLTQGMHDSILARLDQLKQEALDRSIALKQLGMQQEQIDQSNRSIKAEEAYLRAKAAWLKKHSRRNGGPTDPALHPDSYPSARNPNTDAGYVPTSPTDTTGFGGGPVGPGPHIGDNTGAFNVTPPDQINSAIPYASPEAALQWVQTLNPSTDLTQARATLLTWIQNQGGRAMLGPDGHVVAIIPTPEIQQVVDAFNVRYGQSIGGTNA